MYSLLKKIMLTDPEAIYNGATGKTQMDSVGDNKFGAFGAQNVLSDNPNPPFIGEPDPISEEFILFEDSVIIFPGGITDQTKFMEIICHPGYYFSNSLNICDRCEHGK